MKRALAATLIFCQITAVFLTVCAPVHAEPNSAWAPTNFTNPSQHNAQVFRYIIHSPVSGVFDGHTVESVFNYVQFTFSKYKQAMMSASVIDNEKQGVFGFLPFAFILRVPEKNIVAGSYRDILSGFGTAPMSPEDFKFAVETLQGVAPLISPDEMLAGTDTQSWNEIKIIGMVDEPIRVIGILILDADKHKQPMQPAHKLELEKIAAKNRLPIIHIQGTK